MVLGGTSSWPVASMTRKLKVRTNWYSATLPAVSSDKYVLRLHVADDGEGCLRLLLVGDDARLRRCLDAALHDGAYSAVFSGWAT